MRVWEEGGGTSVFLMAITRKDTYCNSTRSLPNGLCFLSSFSLSFNSLKNSQMSSPLSICIPSCSFLLPSVLMWLLCLVLCFIFSLLPPSVWKCDFVLKSVWGAKHWKCDVCKWAQRLMCWMTSSWFESFLFEVVTNAFSMFLWIKGKPEIKRNWIGMIHMIWKWFISVFALIELPKL